MSIITFGCPPSSEYLKLLLKHIGWEPEDEEGFGKLVFQEDGSLALHLPDGSVFVFYPGGEADITGWLDFCMTWCCEGITEVDGGSASSILSLTFEGNGFLSENALTLDGNWEDAEPIILDGGTP